MEAVSQLYSEIVDKNLLVRRIYVTATRVLPAHKVKELGGGEQLDLFTVYQASEHREAELKKEHDMQKAVLDIKKKFGKNAILKGMNLQKGAKTKERNERIGGHKA